MSAVGDGILYFAFFVLHLTVFISHSAFRTFIGTLARKDSAFFQSKWPRLLHFDKGSHLISLSGSGCVSIIRIHLLCLRMLTCLRLCCTFKINSMDMKTPFFSRPYPRKLRKAIILMLVAFVIIAISIPGMMFSKGNTLFALGYFAGFTLLFYSLLHPWQKTSYYAISLAIFVLIPILLLISGGDFLVKMEKAGKLPVHGAEDLAWAIGGIFVAGIIAGIIGIIRSRMFRYDDDNGQ
jgi:hypothetical protein